MGLKKFKPPILTRAVIWWMAFPSVAVLHFQIFQKVLTLFSLPLVAKVVILWWLDLARVQDLSPKAWAAFAYCAWISNQPLWPNLRQVQSYRNGLAPQSIVLIVADYEEPPMVFDGKQHVEPWAENQSCSGFFGLINNRMTESDWLTFNHFNRGNPTKRMNNFVRQVASGEVVYHVKPVE